MQNRSPFGQVGLVLLVIMGIVVALVMSVASRSLSDTVLSRQEKESSATFAMAESGVENALNSLRSGIIPPPTTFQDSASLVTGDYKVESLASYALYVKELESIELDLTGYNIANPLVIFWTKIGASNEDLVCGVEGSGGSSAGIEISAINAATKVVTHSYYDSYRDCSFPNGFGNSLSGGTEYLSKVNYLITSGTTILRIKPIYSGATIKVTGMGLATQLYLIKSRAEGGDAQKEIEVRRGLDATPSIFDFVVFSGETIVK